MLGNMVSDEELVERLTQVLDAADLNTTTTSAIRKQLESELGVDLTHRKAFIREQVDLFLQSRQQRGEEEEDGADQQVVEQLEEREEGDENEEEEEEDGNSAEEEDGRGPVTRRLRAKIHRAMKQSFPKEKKKRAAGGGLSKMCSLSPQLQAVIGETELPRTQVVKQLWVYIRHNNLQDPDNKRKIICNDALRAVFGTEATDMFKMNKLLSKHIWPLDSAEGADEGEPKPKKQKIEKEGGKARGGGILSPIPLSDALTRFLGTGESELPRTEVVKRIWDYIKDHQLQNPADKRQIICDSKLQELFGCETFLGFGVTKLLTTHFLKS